MSVASDIIAKFGGVQKVADLTGLSATQIHRWTYERERGGTGGLVPTKHQQPLLDAARERGIDLSEADFFATREPDADRPDGDGTAAASGRSAA